MKKFEKVISVILAGSMVMAFASCRRPSDDKNGKKSKIEIEFETQPEIPTMETMNSETLTSESTEIAVDTAISVETVIETTETEAVSQETSFNIEGIKAVLINNWGFSESGFIEDSDGESKFLYINEQDIMVAVYEYNDAGSAASAISDILFNVNSDFNHSVFTGEHMVYEEEDMSYVTFNGSSTSNSKEFMPGYQYGCFIKKDNILFKIYTRENNDDRCAMVTRILAEFNLPTP